MKKSTFISIVALLLLFYAGCKSGKFNTNEIVEYVWSYAQTHPNGFTVNILTKESVTKGIVVSYYETKNSFGKESLDKVIEHAKKHNAIVGGWLNKNDTLYYFDSNNVFPDSAFSEALSFAIKNRQSAIYDLTNDSVIWINYPSAICDSISVDSITTSMTN